MKVWIVEASEPLPTIDGNFRDFRCGMLARTLVARGHKVLWWTSTFSHMSKKHRLRESRTISFQDGLQLRLLHGLGYQKNTSPKRILHNRETAIRFFREALQSPVSPDVIFCCLPTLELSEKAVQFGRMTGIPVIIDIRDQWPDHYLTLVPQRLRAVFKIVLASEFRRVHSILRKATGISAISNTYLSWALAYADREKTSLDGVFFIGYPLKSQLDDIVIKMRREELIAQYNFSPEKLTLTFVGTFCSSYALETVIKAAHVLNQSIEQDVRFVLIGDGDKGTDLRAQAAGLKNVVFTGWFDQASITAMLGLTSVGLAPYRDDASMSLPNKPFEYMAAGLPILSSLRGELEELLRDHQIGRQYRAGDALSLVEELRWFVSHPEERAEMGRQSRMLLEDRFSAETVYADLVQYLEHVARSSPRVGYDEINQMSLF
jgi:glycosyltransferase involved in cell wall biosynthesis